MEAITNSSRLSLCFVLSSIICVSYIKYRGWTTANPNAISLLPIGTSTTKLTQLINMIDSAKEDPIPPSIYLKLDRSDPLNFTYRQRPIVAAAVTPAASITLA